MIPKVCKKHFTQLPLIVQILYDFLKQQLPQERVKLMFPFQNDEKDIFRCFIIVEQQKQQQKQVQCQLYELKIIQIQYIIKFFLIQINANKYDPHPPEMEIEGKQSKQIKLNLHISANELNTLIEQVRSNTQSLGIKFEVDSFWINYKKYFPKKINTTYEVNDIKKDNLKALNKIFKQRLLKPLLPKKQENGQIGQKQVIQCIYNNVVLLNRFLKPKDFRNLEMGNSKIYNVIHQQQTYKNIYEQRWGRTGFQLGQRNWIKAYENKIKNLKKMGKI